MGNFYFNQNYSTVRPFIWDENIIARPWISSPERKQAIKHCVRTSVLADGIEPTVNAIEYSDP